jgi:hypothetical protein
MLQQSFAYKLGALQAQRDLSVQLKHASTGGVGTTIVGPSRTTPGAPLGTGPTVTAKAPAPFANSFKPGAGSTAGAGGFKAEMPNTPGTNVNAVGTGNTQSPQTA